MRALLCIGILVSGVTSPLFGQMPSRFVAEYPQAAIALRSATQNLNCKGTMQTHDYEGAVQFSNLRDDGDMSLKRFVASRTTLSWRQRVESFGDEWYFMLNGGGTAGTYEFKGAEFPNALPPVDAANLKFRRWLRCDKFTCAPYNICGVDVTELMSRKDFIIESEQLANGSDLYEMTFRVSSFSARIGDRFLKGRIVFDTSMSWAVTGFDLMYEHTTSRALEYAQGRNTAIRLPNGLIVPKQVTVSLGAPVSGIDTVLGEPVWPDNAIHESATFDELQPGVMTRHDFLPSAFGLPDHLVLVGSPPQPSQSWTLWIVVGIVDIAVFMWWLARRRRHMRAEGA